MGGGGRGSIQISGIQESNAPSEKQNSEIRMGNVKEARLRNAGKTILKSMNPLGLE